MSSLEKDLPHLAAEIRAALPKNDAIKEALADYETARRKEASATTTEDERAEWMRIRHEVLAELMRLIGRRSEPGKES